MLGEGWLLIYPIYIPINIDEPEIFAATGKLSPHDYKRTLKLLHSRPMFRVDEKGCGSVEEAGFPFAPLIAALAPIVIPGAIKAVKSIFNKSKSSKQSKGRLYMGRGDDELDEEEDNTEETTQFSIDESDENSEVNAESDNETQVVPNISEDDNIVDNAGNTIKDTQHSVALETEKKVLEEMFELEKKHFGESKKAVKIDVSL